MKTKNWIKTAAALVSTILFYTGAVCAQDDDGLRLIDAEKYAEAKKVYSTKLKNDPEEAKYYFLLGNIYFMTDKYDSAANFYDKGITVDQKDPFNYIGKGKIYLQQGKKTEAAAQFDKAISISKSRDYKVLTAVGEAYLSTKNSQPKKAIEVLKTALERENKDPRVHIVMGDAWLANRDGGQAMNHYEAAVELNPNLALAHYKVGRLYNRSRNYKLALEAYQKSVNADPNFGPAYQYLGVLYNQMKRYDEAKDAYKKYIDLSENNQAARITFANFLIISKKYEEALKEIDKLTAEDGSNIFLYRMRGYALYEMNRFEESVNALSAFFDKNPDEEKILPQDYEYYAKALAETGSDSMAIIYIDKALENDGKNIDFYRMKGEMTMKMKKYPLAVASYQAAIDSSETVDGKDVYQLGRAYYMNQEFETADTTFAKLIEMYPDYPTGYLWRARSNAELDPEIKEALAKPYYESFIEKAEPEAEKYKKYLQEAYNYLGYYNYNAGEMATAKEFMLKTLEIDPENERALELIKYIENSN